MKNHVIDNLITHNPLDAKTLGGRTMTVTLTGENLHYNDNNVYWTKARSDKYLEYEKEVLRSKSPANGSGKRRMSSLTESFNENDVLCDVHNEVEKLRKKVPEGQEIGFLGINSEFDYR